MEKFNFFIFISIVFILSFTNDLVSCTTFCLKGDNQIVLCKNLDWDFDYGIIVVNRKGLIKKAFCTNNERPIEWTSKFGSITFNHIGKEFPLGGMNEVGLVIEEMNYYWTKYPKPDNRPTLNELQWIQYQLDNFSTVEEVINSDSILRISGDLFKIHYLICDKEGNVATIEFLNGKMIHHSKNTLETPVLTNHRYDESVEALKDYKGFGGTKDIPHKYESLNNFIRASSMIQNYTSDIPIVDYSFNILSSVSTHDTQWSIVYDISNSCIYFKTKRYDQLKYIDLSDFSFTCDAPSFSLDVNTALFGNLRNKFIPNDSKINEQLVFKIYNAFLTNDFLDEGYDKEYFNRIAKYPETINCIND